MGKLTLKNANNEIRKLQNEIAHLIRIKKYFFNKTQPTSKTYFGERVSGSPKKINVFLNYIETLEEKDIDNLIALKSEEKVILEMYVLDEMNRIKEFDKRIYDIIYYRAIKGYKWSRVASITNYSERQAKRIFYDNY